MEGVAWTYDIHRDKDYVRVTYESSRGDLIDSNIPFDTEEEAEQAAQEYIINLEELFDRDEWQ